MQSRRAAQYRGVPCTRSSQISGLNWIPLSWTLDAFRAAQWDAVRVFDEHTALEGCRLGGGGGGGSVDARSMENGQHESWPSGFLINR
jgi:hypothetical protein